MTSVAIVGSGPSAIYTLQALLAATRPFQITVFEAGPTAGVGTPYDPRTTSVAMLANIASIEIPPVGITLLAYLEQCDDGMLAQVGVERGRLGEREFYPRIALGAYYRDRLAVLAEGGRAKGHDVSVLTRHRVVDVVPTECGIDLLYTPANAPIMRRTFEKVVLATGHTTPARCRSPMRTSYHRGASAAGDIGVFGSSLSAIDLAVSIACERGVFSPRGYVRAVDAHPFVITFMSRGGRLPEADFYCPLPAAPAEGFTADDVLACAKAAAPGQVLDVVFARFAATLAVADPDYAARIGLERLTPETFADAYFAERDAVAPLDWARHNLDEARRNHQTKHVVVWRYTILRCHEAFAACLDALDENELERFNTGLKRVFADNYAAVPPLSIQRIIDLYDAGALKIEALADDYELAIDDDLGTARVASNGSVLAFDCVFDARGQAVASEEDFPFPTLRMILKANSDLDDGCEGSTVRVDDDYRLADGINTLRDIWCMSIPFLLGRKPFIQGLTSAAEMGEATAEAIIADLDGRRKDVTISLDGLLETVEATVPVMLADGTVTLAPRVVEAA